MKERCFRPNHKSYPLYGGRGITVCDHWRDSFENFLADMGERPDGKTLDRIDVDGDYEPDNCRWATHAEQVCNRKLDRDRAALASAQARIARRRITDTFGSLSLLVEASTTATAAPPAQALNALRQALIACGLFVTSGPPG